MREAFTDWQPTRKATRGLLSAAITIIESYAAQNYTLTLRQLYYQLVARKIIPNQQSWYKRLGEIVTKGRMAGWIDWDSIVDRGRVPVSPPEWDGPAGMLRRAASIYRVERWKGQSDYVEIWVEKDALSGVLLPVANRLHVRLLACRGYASSTALYDAAQRMAKAWDRGQWPCILYLGDHDPSGLDMTDDIVRRLHLMTGEGMGGFVDVRRLALNMDQILQFAPPPNPTKLSDSRAAGYVQRHGDDSWELDALEPAVLAGLISDEIEAMLDIALWEEQIRLEEKHKEAIAEAIAQVEETLEQE